MVFLTGPGSFWRGVWSTMAVLVIGKLDAVAQLG